MARRRRRRPWYRTRAYRLARTAVLTVTLVVGGIWWSHGTEVPAPGSAEALGAHADVTGSGDAGPGSREEGAPSAPDATDSRPDGPAGTGSEARAPSPSVSSPRTARAGRSPESQARPRPLPRSPATRIVIPYIGVDAPLIDLRLDSERRLPAPPGNVPDIAGWYADGPSPGEQGTAVAVGHLDTNTGPAVFGGLGELERGRRVEVRRADGRSAVYTVDAIRSYEKDKFPNRKVYGDRGRPELRLITCGGNYDRRTGYSGNVVVFAHLTATRGPPTASGKR